MLFYSATNYNGVIKNYILTNDNHWTGSDSHAVNIWKINLVNIIYSTDFLLLNEVSGLTGMVLKNIIEVK